MPFHLLDEAPTADVGFRACGATLNECFRAAADATLEVMVTNAKDLHEEQLRKVRVEAASLDLALLRFLEELIYYKDAEALFLRVTQIDVGQQTDGWTVDATLAGEPIDPSRHQLASDVKAVTLHKLGIHRIEGGWEATVVLDV